MVGRWDRPGIPHRGWTLIDTVDLGAPEHACEMCGREEIRYVHVVAHPHHEDLQVGCVCAERMTGDYEGPRRAEGRLKALEKSRARWLSRRWRRSAAGNEFLNLKGRNVGILPDRFRSERWKWRIDGEFSRAPYLSAAKAKAALFDALIDRGLIGARF